MSIYALEVLCGTAATDRKFLAGILNGRRAELIRQFNLDPEEINAVMAIQATTFQEFGAAIEQIRNTREAVLRQQREAKEGKRHGHEGVLGLLWNAPSIHG